MSPLTLRGTPPDRLPREAKYKGQAGDRHARGARGRRGLDGLVWLGTRQQLELSTFLGINVALSALWLVVAVLLGNTYVKRIGSADRPAPRLEAAHGT